jgi:hypothetical protein
MTHTVFPLLSHAGHLAPGTGACFGVSAVSTAEAPPLGGAEGWVGTGVAFMMKVFFVQIFGNEYLCGCVDKITSTSDERRGFK